MVIRELRKNQLHEALELVWNVFIEFEAPEYSQEGIDEFRNFIDYSSVLKKFEAENMKLWVCITDEKITGVTALRDDTHICLLFVDKNYQKHGIGRKLINEAQRYIINHYSEKDHQLKMTVNSSPYAAEFYHKLGFDDLQKQ